MILLTNNDRRHIVNKLNSGNYSVVLESYNKNKGQHLFLINMRRTRGIERTYPVRLPYVPRPDKRNPHEPRDKRGGLAEMRKKFLVMNETVARLLLARG